MTLPPFSWSLPHLDTHRISAHHHQAQRQAAYSTLPTLYAGPPAGGHWPNGVPFPVAVAAARPPALGTRPGLGSNDRSAGAAWATPAVAPTLPPPCVTGDSLLVGGRGGGGGWKGKAVARGKGRGGGVGGSFGGASSPCHRGCARWAFTLPRGLWRRPDIAPARWARLTTARARARRFSILVLGATLGHRRTGCRSPCGAQRRTAPGCPHRTARDALGVGPRACAQWRTCRWVGAPFAPPPPARVPRCGGPWRSPAGTAELHPVPSAGAPQPDTVAAVVPQWTRSGWRLIQSHRGCHPLCPSPPRQGPRPRPGPSTNGWMQRRGARARYCNP